MSSDDYGDSGPTNDQSVNGNTDINQMAASSSYGTPGGYGTQTVSADAARERNAALASVRNMLSLCTIAFLALLGLALVMLLCINISTPSFWNTWEFWRYFSTVIGLVVAMFSIDLISRSCMACGPSQPHIMGIVFTSIHLIWCLVITGFMISDLANCATRPWCVAPSGSTSVYFLLHAIGFWGSMFFEILIVFTSWRLYNHVSRGCVRSCKRVQARFGAEYMAMHVKGEPRPLNVHPSLAEQGHALAFTAADMTELKIQ